MNSFFFLGRIFFGKEKKIYILFLLCVSKVSGDIVKMKAPSDGEEAQYVVGGARTSVENQRKLPN